MKGAKSPAGGLAKLLWILLLRLAPVVGLVIWLLTGPKR
ncbi:PLDc N-terminal domain-containing protein [Haliea alexandrii]